MTSAPCSLPPVPSGTAWRFPGECDHGRFVVPDPESPGGATARRFDCDLLAAMCAAFLGTGFSPVASA